MPSKPSSCAPGLDADSARFARELAGIAIELGAAWQNDSASGSALAQIAAFGSFVRSIGLCPKSLPQNAVRLYGSAMDRLESRNVADQRARLHRLIDSNDGERIRARLQATNDMVAEVGRLFETFLREFDRSLRRRRGVFFTPPEVVRYIVRSVKEIVASDFAAAERVHVIDPACGCGVFLGEWIEQDRQEADRGRNSIAASRLVGFEVLPATWLISQLLLTTSQDRSATIHRANPLEDSQRWRNEIIGQSRAPALPVILGNPPYANFGRQNRSPWIRQLLEDYKLGLAERKMNLDDDFIKFLRWGQHWIDVAGAGIMAMITSNTYLRGVTHRRMRESLLESFDDVCILDLHGSHRRDEALQFDEEDENVFPIQSGVAIGIFVKRGRDNAAADRNEFRFAEIVGKREDKLAQLGSTSIDTTSWITLPARSPTFRFAPAVPGHASDYESFWPLDRIFRVYVSGVQTKNDALFVGFTRDEVAERVKAHLGAASFDASHIRPYLVAPFDRRWIYYDPRLLGRARYNVMQHMLRPNLGLVFMRQSTNPGAYDHFLAVDCLVSDRVFTSRHGAPFLAPLWLWDDEGGEQGAGDSRQRTEGRRGTSYSVLSTEYEVPTANFSDDFIAAIEQRAASCGLTPPSIFHYLYATVHSLDYRRTYAADLRVAFPRVRLPRDAAEFQRLAEIGRQLVALHLWPGRSLEDEPVGCAKNTRFNQHDIQEFTIGGYRVLRRWKKQRRKRKLSDTDCEYYTRVENALWHTQRLMGELTSPRSSCASST